LSFVDRHGVGKTNWELASCEGVAPPLDVSRSEVEARNEHRCPSVTSSQQLSQDVLNFLYEILICADVLAEFENFESSPVALPSIHIDVSQENDDRSNAQTKSMRRQARWRQLKSAY